MHTQHEPTVEADEVQIDNLSSLPSYHGNKLPASRPIHHEGRGTANGLILGCVVVPLIWWLIQYFQG